LNFPFARGEKEKNGVSKPSIRAKHKTIRGGKGRMDENRHKIHPNRSYKRFSQKKHNTSIAHPSIRDGRRPKEKEVRNSKSVGTARGTLHVMKRYTRKEEW